VVVLWLAAQASPATAARMRDNLAIGAAARQALREEHPAHATGPVPGVTLQAISDPSGPDLDFGPYETLATVALLDRPADQVGEVLRRHWRELTSTATSSARAAALFGITPQADPALGERPADC
jgi:hypothetical protein